MTTIRAAHYGETERRLADDPIVLGMAHDLVDVPIEQLAHEPDETGDRTPRFEFMQAANRTYRARGGIDGGHIGAVAAALLMARDELRDGEPG